MVSPEPVVTPVTRSPSRRTAVTIVPNLMSAPSPPGCVDQVLVGARRVGVTALLLVEERLAGRAGVRGLAGQVEGDAQLEKSGNRGSQLAGVEDGDGNALPPSRSASSSTLSIGSPINQSTPPAAPVESGVHRAR